MSNTHLDYIKLIQDFSNNNGFLVCQKIKDYLCTENFYIKTHLSALDSYDYINRTNHNFAVYDCSKLTSISFENLDVQNKFFTFLNEKPDRWNFFLSFHPISNNVFFDSISFIPDKFFYTSVKNFKNSKFNSLKESDIKVFFEKALSIEPSNIVLICDFLSQFKNQFKNDSLVVSLFNQIYKLPEHEQNQLYSTLGIYQKVSKVNNEDFLNEINTFSFSFDKIKLSGYLTNYIDSDSSLITKDVIWYELDIIAKFLSKKKLHKRDFLLNAITDGYNNQSEDYRIHIQVSSEFTDKNLLANFIQKAIIDLTEKEIKDKPTEKEKNTYLKQLFSSVFLNYYLIPKNVKTNKAKI